MPARRGSTVTASYTSRLPAPGGEYEEESDYDDVSDIGEEAAAAAAASKARCCGGCCGCDDTKTIDEWVFDLTLRPIFNFLLNYFSQPTSFHLVVYFGGGCLAYRYLEGWTTTEAAYFLTVTATTVGYGDFCPASPLGRAFTCFFSLYGISVVLSALTPLIAILHGEWRDDVLRMLGSKDQVSAEDTSLSIVEISRRIDYTRRYMLALLSPIFVLFAGVAFHYFAIRELPAPGAAGVLCVDGYLNMAAGLLRVDEYVNITQPICVDGLGLLDSLYYAVITMTTIGYGDIYPSTPLTQWFAVFYLPFAVIALADAVADVGMISMRRNIRETDYGRVADESLLRDAVRDVPEDGDDPDVEGDEPNFQPMLTEAEFVVDQLLANGLVDTEAVSIIRRQFAHLTRNGKFKPGEEPMLSTRLVYEEIRERALKGIDGLLSAGAEALDLANDGRTGVATFKWNSYEEWLANSWNMRVLARATSTLEQLKGESNAPPAPGMRSLNVNSFRFMA